MSMAFTERIKIQQIILFYTLKEIPSCIYNHLRHLSITSFCPKQINKIYSLMVYNEICAERNVQLGNLNKQGIEN